LIACWLLLLAGALGDLFSTTYILALGGIEINPLMQAVQSVPGAFCTVKLGYVAGIALLSGYAYPTLPRHSYAIALLGALLNTIPAVSNTIQILFY
jgi:hypothetical protein